MKNQYFCCLALLCLFSAVQAHINKRKESHGEGFSLPNQTLRFALVRTSDRDKIGSLGGDPLVQLHPDAVMLCNSALCELVAGLNIIYREQDITITDLTGYSEPVDIILQVSLADLPALRRALRVYDLDIVPGKETCQADDEVQARQDS